MRRSIYLLALVAGSASSTLAKPHDHNFDLVDVRWRLSLDIPNERIRGDVTNTVKPPAGLEEIRLDAIGLSVESAAVDGARAAWRVEGDEIVISVPSGQRDGRLLAVRLVYTAKPEGGVYFVPDRRAYPSKSGMVYSQGEAEDNRNWIPTVDHPGDKATSEAFIEVPSDQFALSNGRLVGTEERGSTKIYHWRMLQPHSTYLISFAAGEYAEGREEWNGVPILYYVPKGLEAEGKQAFEGTADMVRLFSEITGFPYPYAKYSQSVVADFMFGGMENITCTTQTIGTLHPASVHPLADSTGLVAHELAHQWFGDTITCEDWPHIWVNEGFASFLPAFYIRDRDGQDAFDLTRHDTLAGAYGAAQDMSRAMIKPEFSHPMELFDGNAYGGGAARMFMLMHELGETTFWDGVREYLERYRYKNVTTEKFFDVMSERAGRDLDAFRKQWFYTPGAPKITVGRSGTTVTIRQSTPGFTLDLPVAALVDGRWRIYNASLNGAETTIEIPEEARLLLADPLVWLMGSVEYDLGYTAAEWEALYRSAPNAAQKARLIGTFPEDLRAGLAAKLADDEALGALRSRLLDAVGADASALLLRQAADPDPYVRRSALQAMGRQPRSDSLVDALREVWEKDPNDLLRRAALESLVNLTGDDALVREAWGTPGFQETFRIFALGRIVARSPEEGRRLCLEQLRNPTNEALRVQAINHLGALKDENGKREVFDALVKVVQERSFGARTSAIRALQQYGDPKAIPYLEPLAKNPLHLMRNPAIAAIEALRG